VRRAGRRGRHFLHPPPQRAEEGGRGAVVGGPVRLRPGAAGLDGTGHHIRGARRPFSPGAASFLGRETRAGHSPHILVRRAFPAGRLAALGARVARFR
jgi:hypothetical protein